MKTARIGSFTIVEIIKQTAKTSIVREITSYSSKEYRVKNSQLEDDEKVMLTEETAKKAATVLDIDNPHYGIKAFHYNEQPLGNNEFCHTIGQGSNSKCLFKSEMHRYRVISFND